MKTLLNILLGLLFALQGIAQVEKVALAEHFTNSRCSICASKNPALFSLLDNNPEVLHIAYHPSSPYSTCIFSLHNVAGNDGRANYYGVYGGTPRIVVDGTVYPPSTPLLSQEQLDAHLNKLADFSITIDHRYTEDDSVKAVVTVKRVSGSGMETMNLVAQLVENKIEYAAPNGETIHHNVFRNSLLQVPVSLANFGDSAVFTGKYATDPAWQQEEMVVVAFLQNEQDKSLLQAARSDFASPINSIAEEVDLAGLFFPNPVADRLNFSQALLRDYSKATLYTIYGKKISESDLRSSMAVQFLSPGTYVLVFHTNSGNTVFEKIVKGSR